MLQKVFYVMLAVWFVFWSEKSNWKTQTLKPESFIYTASKEKNVKNTISKEKQQLTDRCQGFVGQCEFEKLGIKVTLNYKGARIQKPFLDLAMLYGDEEFRMETYFFGKRILQVSSLNGELIQEFYQIVWNTHVPADFSHLIFIDSAQKNLFVSLKEDGFKTSNEMGYKVQLGE